MEMDVRGDAGDKMEVNMQEEDIHSMIRSCIFNMKMKMIESARKQVTLHYLVVLDSSENRSS